MGTDIHLLVQIQRDPTWTPNGRGYWSTVHPPAWWPRDEYATKRIAELTTKLPDGQAAEDLALVCRDWGEDRNYDLFGVLANVRNASGFAGVQRLDTGWPSIAPDRGLPEDLDATDNEYEGKWLGDHSHTWLTLEELLAYPWTTARNRVGVVTLEQFAERERTGVAYDTWIGDTWGPGIVTFTSDEVRAGVTAPLDARIHVRDSWPVTAAEACGRWHDTLLPAFQRFADEEGVTPNRVRLVMGFDS